ncbi:hypothetical protein DPM12_19055 [Phytoactinopolyspora halophila]|uniref:Cell wall-binding repeat 2 family protein n=1 Tax=Phytoactinopolyspora halophila TaxID=1981511 RepID=A0A329QEY6_9ACTN|nr:hypothetical protein DPM12_19055 [Phytoactinopolyspora halophila]
MTVTQWTRTVVVMAWVWAGLAAGCSGSPEGEEAPDGAPPGEEGTAETEEPARSATSMPAAGGDDVTVLSTDDGAEQAIAMSEAIYDHAPVVLLAEEDELASQAAAAPVAVALGVPLLLVPDTGDGTGSSQENADSSNGGETADDAGTSGDDAGTSGDDAGTSGASSNDAGASGDDAVETSAVENEIGRLDAEAILTFGAEATRRAEEMEQADIVVEAPSDRDELAEVSGVQLHGERDVTQDDLVAAVAASEADGVQRLVVDGAEPPESSPTTQGSEDDAASGGDGTTLPAMTPPEPLDDLTVLAAPEAEGTATVATARASGARVLVTEESDPRADGELIDELAESPAGPTMAIGSEFESAERLRARLDVAATGAELPGGGQVLLPHRRFIALYGTPRSAAMGALGEQSMDETFERAEEVAAEYEPVVDEPVVPTLELITTIAHTEPGPEGAYSLTTPVSEVRPWVDAAAEAGVYVVLDLQPGRTDFLTQAREYEELLAEPHVGLALDPEWRIGEGQRHLEQIGSVDAEEINEVAEWLAELTAEHQLPQKLLVLHQFKLSMIDNRDEVDTSHDELAVLIHADGFGTPDLKFETWNRLRADAPDDVWWGWKNFYDEDTPTFTPAETMDIDPAPWFVSYQ